jgi:PAS domain S-box-containing protein
MASERLPISSMMTGSSPAAPESLAQRRQRNADYQSIFENATVGLYRSSPDGVVLRANPALVAMNGYESETQMIEDLRVNGNAWYVSPTRRHEFQEAMAVHDSVKEFVSEVYRMHTRERIWISENAWTVRDENGTALFYEGVVEDISERVKAQAELAKARVAAEAASEAKSTFLAVMSHELRSPLNAIIGFSEIIANRLYGDNDPRYFDYAEDIRVSGSQLLALIEDILDLSKIGAGHMHLREAIVDVPSIAIGTVRLFAASAQKAGLQLSASFPEGYPALKADAVRLKQVMTNLVANAVKFTPDGGEVAIGGQQTEDGLCFWVADTGCGMTAEEAGRALEPFVQIGDNMTRSKGGTGLGLPISKDLVELHGGRLTIDSEKGKGTRVLVWLPRERIVDQD